MNGARFGARLNSFRGIQLQVHIISALQHNKAIQTRTYNRYFTNSTEKGQEGDTEGVHRGLGGGWSGTRHRRRIWFEKWWCLGALL